MVTSNGLEGQDMRSSRRFPWIVEMRGSVLSPLPEPDTIPIVLMKGVTENIGTGGAAILIERILPVNTVLRCEFTLSESPVMVPTLMQVRWAGRVEKGQYKVGLKFLV